MAASSSWKPYSSLCDAPTNLKEAIDWVLRVTGKDGKKLGKDECICGLAAAVTDLLQSVELEYNGYEGESKGKGAQKEDVDNHIKNLFFRVQSIEGTHVVRQLIDGMTTESQLARLIGWSKGKYNNEQGCTDCMCLVKPKKGTYLGKGCTRCKNSNGGPYRCNCRGGTCTAGVCKCAEAGKCCKCCCTSCEECKKKECRCVTEEKSYRSAYEGNTGTWIDGGYTITWAQIADTTFENRDDNLTDSERRSKCARILLGSVCLIWSGLTYIYWTGRKQYGSPYWNNHILDGSGMDDGTLSQWLQALGFPKDMLNSNAPGNRLDEVITDDFGKTNLFKGFNVPGGLGGGVQDKNGNTAKNPPNMNYAGFIYAINRDGFNDSATVFKDPNQHKQGSLYKLYILSGAYFTGLQKKTTTQSSTPNNPKTIREILYWLSALPYSPAYPKILKHGKDRLKQVVPEGSNNTKTLSFHQQGRTHPITVDEYNLFAHFQAVTQYCPLVLIGIQGGIHSTKSMDKALEPPIHSLYANTQCNFTYPTVPIQAYNQVVHYIRGLFYQLYFLRKQCAVKVTCGGKWRECRYGKNVVSKGVISWMCLTCNPMEHDRKCRVEKVNGVLVGLVEKVKEASDGAADGEELIEVLKAIGEVAIELGNAQEALERKKVDGIKGVIKTLGDAKMALMKAKNGLNEELEEEKGKLNTSGGREIKESQKKLETLTTRGALHTLVNRGGSIDAVTGGGGLGLAAVGRGEVEQGKNKVSEAIHKVREVLTVLKDLAEKEIRKELMNNSNKFFSAISELKEFLNAINDLTSICDYPKCTACYSHSTKCGKKPQSKYCDKCHQQYMDGFPSPLQAFLEDRLPGFSCDVVRNDNSEQPYPPAASHLHHTSATGQCCPVPMGFRNSFYKGSTGDCTGQRLYGILYFFSNEKMMESCVYRLVRITSALSATTPQVLGDVFGFFRGGMGEKNDGWNKAGLGTAIGQTNWILAGDTTGDKYKGTFGDALVTIKGNKSSHNGNNGAPSASPNNNKCHCDLSSLSDCTMDQCAKYLSPLTGELYTAVSATFGHVYLSWVLYLSDALEGGLQSLASEFQQIECRGCKGQCDPNKCKKGEHGQTSGTGSALCNCSSIVSCTGVLPVLYRHGFSYGNPFNLEGYQQEKKGEGDYSIEKVDTGKKHCHEFLESLNAVIMTKQVATQKNASKDHPLTNLLSQVGKLQYDIRLPWIFVLAVAWLLAVLYLAFGAIWPLDWTHMRSHWLRGGEHQWQCMWYKVMTERKGRVVLEGVEYFGGKGMEEVKKDNSTLRTVLLSGAKGWGGG